MKTENSIIEELIVGGLIGAGLGALLSDNEKEGATIGAIAGAVIFATFKANEEAKKTKVPFYVQENNVLYKIDADGKKHFVRNVETPKYKLNKRFKLK